MSSLYSKNNRIGLAIPIFSNGTVQKHLVKRYLKVEVGEVCESNCVVIVFVFVFNTEGKKIQWSCAITLAIFIWLFAAFWAAMPLIGWGEYDYEPLRTCCTLDLSKGDRYGTLLSG